MSKTQADDALDKRPVALVTGGSRRIGRAIVEDLAANGFAVVIHFNDSSQDAKAVADEIRARGGEAITVRADLCNRVDLTGLIDQAAAAIGRPIELLVNSASIFEGDALTDFEWQTWDRHFGIHVEAPVMLARKLAEALPPKTSGLVVNLIDQRVLKPTPRYFTYTLSKSALWAATRTMAQALAPKVRVNALGPGPALPNASQTVEEFASVVDTLLLKRGPDLAEFGETIRYLWRTKSITGQMIAIDGGQHLAWQTPDATGVGE